MLMNDHLKVKEEFDIYEVKHTDYLGILSKNSASLITLKTDFTLVGHVTIVLHTSFHT